MESLPSQGDLAEERADTAPGPIKPLGDPRTHYWLALEMSQVVGLDLQAEIGEGRLSADDWAGAVSRCRSCDWSGECPAWMAMQRLDAACADAPVERPEAPAACANADTFNTLREGASAVDGLLR